jgi:DNA-binding response OmpR family regulator
MDDDPMMADLLNQFISWKFSGWKAYTFTDPMLLYRKIKAGEVGARDWVVDIMMPEVNGCQIAAAIRQQFDDDQVILGYTALEPGTIQDDPEYRDGLQFFTQVVRKNEGIARLLGLAESLMKD